jgi:hypothetical protein
VSNSVKIVVNDVEVGRDVSVVGVAIVVEILVVVVVSGDCAVVSIEVDSVV